MFNRENWKTRLSRFEQPLLIQVEPVSHVIDSLFHPLFYSVMKLVVHLVMELNLYLFTVNCKFWKKGVSKYLFEEM